MAQEEIDCNSRKHTPEVIVISGLSDQEVARHALELGAFDYLIKPISPDNLISSVEACLAHSEYRHQHWWDHSETD